MLWPYSRYYAVGFSSNVWWYNSLNQSWTWAGAHNFYWFTKNSGRGSSLKYFSDLKLGDLLQIDFEKDGFIDHSMIVTQISGSKIYLSYHTPNTLNELLDNIQSRNPNAAFYGWRL